MAEIPVHNVATGRSLLVWPGMAAGDFGAIDHVPRGVARGTMAVVDLGGWRRRGVALHGSFDEVHWFPIRDDVLGLPLSVRAGEARNFTTLLHYIRPVCHSAMRGTVSVFVATGNCSVRPAMARCAWEKTQAISTTTDDGDQRLPGHKG